MRSLTNCLQTRVLNFFSCLTGLRSASAASSARGSCQGAWEELVGPRWRNARATYAEGYFCTASGSRTSWRSDFSEASGGAFNKSSTTASFSDTPHSESCWTTWRISPRTWEALPLNQASANGPEYKDDVGEAESLMRSAPPLSPAAILNWHSLNTKADGLRIFSFSFFSSNDCMTCSLSWFRNAMRQLMASLSNEAPQVANNLQSSLSSGALFNTEFSQARAR
mmetsp:Transcript_58146/g.189457  ORF Transcript_58146/g.189457 Transcript_58146/m.189457 type:complete len:224 (-) Transcript_58146:3739-4410(-)